jgi:L-alanine-DL-glutamate epimerase-like enolase superfamily enzyme
LKKQRAGASFKAIKLKLGFDEDFWLRWSIRQAVSETMIIMVDANHACDATAAISRPHTRLKEHREAQMTR